MSLQPKKNTLNMRLLGAGTILKSQAACDSSARAAMWFGFLSQMLVLKEPTSKRMITGAEREYGKYTMRVEMPCDGRIVKILRKYPRHQGFNSFKQNSETTIIYEDQATGELGSVIVRQYHWNHKVFGFQYKFTEAFKRLAEGDFLAKGTVLADSPSIQPNGDYRYGIEANTVFMSHPAIIEDGLAISESFREKITSRGYGEKTIEWGQDRYPLNLYGNTDDDYIYFPDIGERVRHDGVLFALRKYDPVLAVCDMTADALMHLDHTFDDITYIPLSSVDDNDLPIVEDVAVWKNHNQDLWRTPTKMEEQVKKYNQATRIYHTAINDVYESEVRRRGKANPVKITHQYHAQLVACRKNDNNIERAQLPKAVVRTYRRNKLDHYRVTVYYGWNVRANIGSKMSDSNGSKGVVVRIIPDADMPHYYDDYGNRVVADVIASGHSTINRMCLGRPWEHYTNATTIEVEKRCKQLIAQGSNKEAMEYLFSYYQVVSPEMYEKSLEILPTEQDKIRHTIEAITEGLQIWLPPTSEAIGAHGIHELMTKFPLVRKPVTYRDLSGHMVTTVKKYLIAPLYMVVLEKIGDDWGATSIPKRQHHGIPGKLTDTDKANLPWRDQSIKVFGESEVRLGVGVLHPTFMALMVNLPNSPAMCEEITRALLLADKPTDIDMIVDYRAHAKLQGRSAQYLHHMLNVSGVRMVRGDSK
nr:MAG TPA: DNA-directed RNA polymerase subunit alpha [Caudoviricetes sp.]